MKTAIHILYSLFLIFSCSKFTWDNNHQDGREKRRVKYKEFDGVKKRLMLLTIFNESPHGGEDLGINATEELRKELLRTGRFVINDFSIDLFGNSKKIYAGGGGDLFQLSRKAKKMGINMIVFGRIISARIRENIDEVGLVKKTNAYTESKIEIRIYDTNAGREVFKETIKGFASDNTYRFFSTDEMKKIKYRRDLLRYGLKIAVRRAITQIIRVSTTLDWVGRVAKVVGNRIYISAGRKSGININDILQVVTKGEEIFDQDTGALIGISQGEIKGTVEVIDFFGVDGAIAILHSGGSVVQGDFVKLY
ncbi:MAG: hypothetical protein OXB84_08195 [Halobacteriovoraceae bacterium]|nr:hypothetical protein [Halobacteriovoraceae bacterium]